MDVFRCSRRVAPVSYVIMASGMSSFKKGDEVFLSVGNFIVGSGVVQKVRPDDTCQRCTIGEGRISVLVDNAIDVHCELPILCPSARTLGEAVDSCIIWDIGDVSLKNDHVENEDTSGTRVISPIVEDGIGPDVLGKHVPETEVVFQLLKKDVEDSLDNSPPKSNHEEVEDENGGQSAPPSNGVQSDPSNYRPTSSDGVDGDEVYLLLFGVVVAKGIVFKVDPMESCHNVDIGKGNISVRVVEVIEGFENEQLKYPHDGADTIGESVNSIIKWSLIDVKKVVGNNEMAHGDSEESDDDYEELDEIAKTSKDAPENFGRGNEKIGSKDYKQRSNWFGEDVEVFCPERVTLIASGTVLVFAAYSAVDNEPLGETHVGVTISRIIQKEFFPKVQDFLAPLVKWPIEQVKLIKDGRFLGDIVSEEVMKSNDEPRYSRLQHQKRGLTIPLKGKGLILKSRSRSILLRRPPKTSRKSP